MLFLLNGCLSLRQTSALSAETARTVVLKGNPSTGYVWRYTINNPEIITIEETHSYRGDSDFVGSPSEFTYTVRPLKEGTTTVFFIYARPWEEKPVETRQFTAVVRKDGSLTLSENQ